MQQHAYGNQAFQPLPPPTGKPPYHLSLDSVLTSAQMNAIITSGNLTFHVVGDTGGVQFPLPQQSVADAMEADFSTVGTNAPAFFYHLGDVVYYFGEAANYYPQFYEPYVHYPAPIFAIPGNHDGDINPTAPYPKAASLEAFATNFCAASPQITTDAGEISRDAMTQPNVYWTLDTPFSTMIGLYSNVPEGGEFQQDQIDWLVSELQNAPPNKALMVSAHHPPFSADATHAGSTTMVKALDGAFNQAKITPDIVFTGHVHDYQRFTRKMPSGQDLPYIVAGAGGYWHLHTMQKQPDGSAIQVPYNMPESGVILESYCDDRHGYLKMNLAQNILSGEYYAIASSTTQTTNAGPQLIDSFSLDLKQRKLIKS